MREVTFLYCRPTCILTRGTRPLPNDWRPIASSLLRVSVSHFQHDIDACDATHMSTYTSTDADALTYGDLCSFALVRVQGANAHLIPRIARVGFPTLACDCLIKLHLWRLRRRPCLRAVAGPTRPTLPLPRLPLRTLIPRPR
jgi:hypothetical protein